MLVSAKEMLEKAKAGKYAVGQFNINNLEWTKAVLTALRFRRFRGVTQVATLTKRRLKTSARRQRFGLNV